jgi:ribosomal protein L32
MTTKILTKELKKNQLVSCHICGKKHRVHNSIEKMKLNLLKD